MGLYDQESFPIVRGAVAVLAEGGKWLMIQRAEGITSGGCWCFPGGAVEDGERPTAALQREIDEELGLTIEPGRCVWRWARDDQALEIEWWTAAIRGGVLRPNPAEVQQARWMAMDQIRSTENVLPNNLEFLEYAERKGLLP